MKKLYHFIVFLLLFSGAHIARAQYYQVSHLSGTQSIGGNNVTVNHVGPGTASYTTNPCGAFNTYCMCSNTNNGFKFSFSKPITRIRFHIYSLAVQDTGRIWVNGVKYTLTAANINNAATSTVGCTTLVASTAFNGDLVSTMSGPGCGSTPGGFNGQIDIAPNYLMDSVRIIQGEGNCLGFGAYVYFAMDTFVYLRQPFTATSLCPGDTFKVPYYVSDYFNSGNNFSVQLSNAAGSFAAPVTIGTRASAFNDTVTCVIPRTTAAGTGYRIRIVSSSPSATSYDNGTDITIKALAANRIVGSNSPICEPDTVRLNSSSTTAGVTYSWTGPSGFSSNTQNTKTGATSASANSGNYIVTMTTSQGCVTKDTTVVTVKPLPAKPTAGSNSPLCTGATLNLTGSSSTSGVSYSWIGPNSFSSGTQNPSKGSVTTADNGSYIVTATLNGCSRKDTTAVTVYPTTPTPTAGNTGPYCVGSDIQLTATTVAGATYTWTGPSFSSTDQNPLIATGTLANAGSYTVYATANGCNSGTSSTTVSVVNGPSVNIYPSPRDTICGSPTGSATFVATAINPGGTPSYQWYKNGTLVTTTMSNTYTATGIQTGDVFYAKLVPGTGAACTTPVNSNKITMTVMPYIAPSVSISVSPDSTVWSGVMLTFTATATNAGNNPKYQWKVNGVSMAGALSNVWGASNLNDKDKVTCEVTSSYICPQPQKVTSNTITLKVKAGINNLEANNISIYPNPTQTTLTVEGVSKGTMIQLKDVLGRQVIHTTATQTKTVLHTAQLTAGNYLLILTTADGEVMTEKVVKE